ncbi:porin [Noviherbaspirillum aerium]|uniref:porin n=1 Tax=Noviherbaspirillum aerium TaxID=2588497 RepID=UPI00124F46B1
MGAVAHTRNNLFADSDVTLISLGYNHNLSERTDVYLFFAFADNDANAHYALGGNGFRKKS